MARIAFVEVTATVSMGGVQTCVWRLADALVEQGHQVTVIGGEGTVRLDVNHAVEVWTFPFVSRDRVVNLGSRFRRLIERASFAWHARHRVADARFDWVVINKPFDFFWAWILPADVPTRVAFLSGGTDFYFLDRLLSRRIAAWMSVSHFNAWQLHARYKGWPGVVYNGVNPTQFQSYARDESTRREFGLNPPAIVFGFVGRLTGWKGAAVVIDAMAQPELRERPVQLWIVGQGEQLLELQTQVKRLGLNDRVIFGPAVKHGDVPGLYRTIDVGVFPSIGDEAFGISLAEAMCCGRPVIASYIGGMPEVVGNEGTCGVLVPPRDVAALASAMVKFADNEAARLVMGRAARERIISHFTWRHAAERLWNVLAAA